MTSGSVNAMTKAGNKLKRESSKKMSTEDPGNDYFGLKLPVEFCPRILNAHQ